MKPPECQKNSGSRQPDESDLAPGEKQVSTAEDWRLVASSVQPTPAVQCAAGYPGSARGGSLPLWSDPDSPEDRNVIAIRQIHEQLANVIEVPAELRNRRTEVIFLTIDAPEGPAAVRPEREEFSPDKFFGSLPDFPARAPQGEFETRLELL